MSNIKAFSFYKSYFDCLEDLEEKNNSSSFKEFSDLVEITDNLLD